MAETRYDRQAAGHAQTCFTIRLSTRKSAAESPETGSPRLDGISIRGLSLKDCGGKSKGPDQRMILPAEGSSAPSASRHRGRRCTTRWKDQRPSWAARPVEQAKAPVLRVLAIETRKGGRVQADAGQRRGPGLGWLAIRVRRLIRGPRHARPFRQVQADWRPARRRLRKGLGATRIDGRPGASRPGSNPAVGP